MSVSGTRLTLCDLQLFSARGSQTAGEQILNTNKTQQVVYSGVFMYVCIYLKYIKYVIMIINTLNIYLYYFIH